MATLKDLFRSSNKDIDHHDSISLIDQETQGIRTTEYLPSIPRLYGSETLRIEGQRTSTVTDMKESRGLELDGGLIGDLLDSATGQRASSLTELENYVGDKLGIPKNQTPTRIAFNPKFQKGSEQDTMITLGEIRNDSEGTEFGKFLKQTEGGTPNQIIQQGLGNLLSLGKDSARKALLGQRPVDNPNSVEDPERLENNSIIYNSGDQKYSILTYGFRQPDSEKSQIPSDAFDDVPDDYVKNFSLRGRNTKRGERSRTYYTENRFQEGTERMLDRQGRTTRMLFTKADGDDEVDYTLDSILVKIGDIRFNLATITGLNESFSPSWNSSQMVGSPFSQHTYTQISRTVSFNLKLYSMNPEEHKEMWRKVERLGKLVYPLDYQSVTGFITPPITNLTIGSMYKNKFGFIDSLSYTVDDNTTWDLGFGSSVNEDSLPSNPFGVSSFQGSNVDTAGKDWKLPKIIDVDVSYTFVESRNDVEGKSLYTFEPQSFNG